MAISYRLSSGKRAPAGKTNRKCLDDGGRRGKLRFSAKNMRAQGQSALGQGRDRLVAVSKTRNWMDLARSSRTLGKAGARAKSKARAYFRRASRSFQRFIGNVEGKCLLLRFDYDISHDADPFVGALPTRSAISRLYSWCSRQGDRHPPRAKRTQFFIDARPASRRKALSCWPS